jgi:hypothetical protein
VDSIVCYFRARRIAFSCEISSIRALNVDGFPSCNGGCMGIFCVFHLFESLHERTFVPEERAPVKFSLLDDDVIE